MFTTEQFDIEGNDVSNKFIVAGAAAPKKAIDLRNELFEYFIDFRSSLKARLPKKYFPSKGKVFIHRIL